MLNTKEELIEEGKQILVKCEELKDIQLCLGPKPIENESSEEFEIRRQQFWKFIERVDDWLEYARAYIFEHQFVPNHYDEFMQLYQKNNKGKRGAYIVRQTLRIIETCK